MPAQIGPKVAIDGYADYKSKINNLINQGKALASEMNAVQSSFSKSATAQEKNAATGKVLAEQIRAQKDLVKQLTEVVEKTAEAYEENADETLKWKTALNNATAELGRMENGMDDAGESASIFGDVLKANILSDAIMSGLRQLVDMAKELSREMITTAAQVKAENSQMEQTFKELQGVAEEAIGRVAKESGILETRLNKSASAMYAFARSSGGSTEESMELMETALKAAADAAAYYDRSLEDTTETLQSFLKGNFANDAALGVSATETTRNAAAMELFGKKYNELSEIQKQQTLLKMVTDAQKLSGAMGQAARESSGWENVMGNLNETWRQFQAKVGAPVLEAIIPVIQQITAEFQAWQSSVDWEAFSANVTNIASNVIGFAQFLIEHGEGILTILTGIGAGFAAWKITGIVTSAVTAVQTLIGVLKGAAGAQMLLNGALTANPIGIVIAAVAALVAVIVRLWNTNEFFRDSVIAAWHSLRDSVMFVVNIFIQAFTVAIPNAITFLTNGIKNAFEWIRSLRDQARTWGQDIITGFINGIVSMINNLVATVRDVANRVRSFLHFSRPDEGPLRDYETWMPDMMAGLAKGIRSNAYMVEDALESATAGMSVAVNGAAAGGNTNQHNYGGFNINIYPEKGQNVNEIADAVMYRIQNAVNSRTAVFA